jgi:hypothetical protein
MDRRRAFSGDRGRLGGIVFSFAAGHCGDGEVAVADHRASAFRQLDGRNVD